MASRRPPNPFARYKRQHGLSWYAVADRIGRSLGTVTKLGNEQILKVSPTVALEIERRTGGEIRFLDVYRWTYDRLVNGPIRDAA